MKILTLREFYTNSIFMSLQDISEIPEGLTYDDVLLVPAYS